MPVVFGVEVGYDEDVDWDWDGQLIDNTTGRKVFDLGHQYVPPEQLFASFKDAPCLLSCENCATVMRVEELLQVKMEFHPGLDVNDVFNNMKNAYRSEIVPICNTCMQRMAGMLDRSCPPLPSKEAEVNGDPINSMSQANNWTVVDVKREENEVENKAEVAQMKQDFASAENNSNLNAGIIDSGVEMEDSDTSGEGMEDEDMQESYSSCEEEEIERMEDSCVDSSAEDATTYTCNICDSEFETACEFGKHTRTHDRISAATCPVCSVHLSHDKFYGHLEMHGRTIERDLKHMKKINRKETIKKLKLRKCSICSWAFHSRSELKRHKRETHFKCVFCTKYFKAEKQRKKHVLKGKCDKNRQSRRTPSPGLEYMCTICQKVLPSQEDLSDHLKMHITFKKCKICNSKVRSGEHFKNHMRQHETAPKEYSVDNSSFTTVPQQFVDERNSSLLATPEHPLEEEGVDMPATVTTWRQLSLQLKNKKSPVEENGTLDINRNNSSDKSNITQLTNTVVGSSNPFRNKSLVSKNTSADSFTNIRQSSCKTKTPNVMQYSTERGDYKSKKVSSPEKENKNQLSEPQEDFVLEKKFSLKSNTKRIYFKRSPDILGQLANKLLKHAEINVNERAQSCTP